MVDNADQLQTALKTVVSTLLLTDLVDSTTLVERLGDARAAEVFALQDRLARDLLGQHSGQEIDKTDGFLLLFARPIDAVRYALAYHAALESLSESIDEPLQARAGIHLGEIILHENTPEDVARGAKPIEVEGLSKPLAARVMSLAQPGQTLMTQAAFNLARRATVGSGGALGDGVTWLAHGPYLVKGCEEPIDVSEVGIEGSAPLTAPPDSEKAKRLIAAGEEETLGWRPAPGLIVPLRKGWMLERKLGAGGFGEVWLASHERTRNRRVFKFCFNADRLRSLKRELALVNLMRDALGDRDDISRLYDVQLDEPPFFLESEFTQAGSLIDWAEQSGGIGAIDLDTRIDLVARTARAVAAAHSIGVLHKDIKPANILIWEDEECPRPRLSDFGIGALADDAPVHDADVVIAGLTTGFDSDGNEGTRIYTPPETLAGRPFTALGDVYALGVFLYQMVVGDLERPLASGWERDVPYPLLRADIAGCVDGNVDQRTGSAQGLAKKLEALPLRSRQYRRRVAIRTAAIASVLMVVLLTASGALLLHERNLRDKAETAEAKKSEVLRFIVDDIFPVADPTQQRAAEAAGGDVTVLEAVDRAYATIKTEDRLAEDPEVRAAVLQIIGEIYKNHRRYQMAEEVLIEALRLLESSLGPDDPLITDAMFELANAKYFLREHELALGLYEDCLTRRRAEGAEDSVGVSDCLNGVGSCFLAMGRNEEAEEWFRETMGIRRRIARSDPDAIDPMRIAAVQNNLGTCLRRQGKHDEALALFDAALETARAEGGEEHVHVATALHNAGWCLALMSRYDEAAERLASALEIKRLVFGPAHISSVPTLDLLAQVELRRGRHGEAVAAARLSLELRSAASRRDRRDDALAKSMHSLGEYLFASGDFEEAEEHLRNALELRVEGDAPASRVVSSRTALGRCLSALERFEDAERELVESYRHAREELGSDHQGTLSTREALVELYDAWARPEDAARYRPAGG